MIEVNWCDLCASFGLLVLFCFYKYKQITNVYNWSSIHVVVECYNILLRISQNQQVILIFDPMVITGQVSLTMPFRMRRLTFPIIQQLEALDSEVIIIVFRVLSI